MSKYTARQIVAVDIDEVLAIHNQALAEWHNSEYGTTHAAQSYYTDYWSEVWNVSSEEAERRAVAFHASGAHARLMPVESSREVLKQLKVLYELVVITVRRQSTVQHTHQWIEQHYPGVFKGVHFLHAWDLANTITKAQLCLKLGAKFLVDDSIKHCTFAAQSGIQAILFGDYSWNRTDLLPKGVKRAKGWTDVAGILLKQHKTVDNKQLNTG